jgi:hypothetical protein
VFRIYSVALQLVCLYEYIQMEAEHCRYLGSLQAYALFLCATSSCYVIFLKFVFTLLLCLSCSSLVYTLSLNLSSFIPCVKKQIETCYIKFHYCARFSATLVFEFHTIYNILNRKNVINQSTI